MPLPSFHKKEDDQSSPEVKHHHSLLSFHRNKEPKDRQVETDSSHPPTEDTAPETTSQYHPETGRPITPPKGSKVLPWESYSNLPDDHPVFLYPQEVREKMYAKGIDPVTRADMDKRLRGIEYQKHSGVKSGVKNILNISSISGNYMPGINM